MFKVAKVSEFISNLQLEDHRVDSVATVKCKLDIAGDELIAAAKAVSGNRLANELAASWLAKKLGFADVPEIILVDDPMGILKNYKSFKKLAGIKFMASIFSSIPTFSVNEYEDILHVANSCNFAKIIVFDVLIANRDRVDRNILWDNDGIFVFDHDQAFFGLSGNSKTLQECQTDVPTTNFESRLMFTSQSSRVDIINLAKFWGEKLIHNQIDELDELIDRGIISDIDCIALKNFIIERSKNLCQLVEVVLKRHPLT